MYVIKSVGNLKISDKKDIGVVYVGTKNKEWTNSIAEASRYRTREQARNVKRVLQTSFKNSKFRIYRIEVVVQEVKAIS